MAHDEASNGPAAVQLEQHQQEEQQQQLGEDSGIPQLPGAPGSEEHRLQPQGDASGQEGPCQGAHQEASGGYQQQQQGEANPNAGLTEEERTARKIFVGGLNRNTTAESLKEYFSTFGAVHHTEVLFDKLTGRSRGFGFVTFEEAESINNVVDRHHTVDDSQLEELMESSNLHAKSSMMHAEGRAQSLSVSFWSVYEALCLCMHQPPLLFPVGCASHPAVL